jgi:hypothetical protein
VPTFRDLKRYVERSGWTLVERHSRGRSVTGDHWRCEKELPDGTILRTKVSHGLNKQIGDDLFARILRDQLQITRAQFEAALAGDSPEEPRASTSPIGPSVPGWLVQRLIETAGIGEEEVRTMSRDEAVAAWDQYRTRTLR